MGFNKFQWIDAVASDPRLKVGERFVLTNTAIRYVLYGEDIFRVRQTTIAEHFAISVRTVREAISRGRHHGYLVLAEGRKRGRSHHGPDAHRLVIPADRAAINDVIPAEIDRNTGTNRPEYRQNTTEIPAAPNTPTSGNGDLKVFGKDVSKGEEEGRGSASPLTPSSSLRENNPSSPYCARHPEGTDDPCHACGQARRRDEATQAEAQRNTDEARRIKGIPHCERGDNHGYIHDRGVDRDTGTPLASIEADRVSSAHGVARGQERPLNHDDVPHPETWTEYLAAINEDRNFEDIVPADKPSRFCAQHPGGTVGPCHTCGWARTKNEEWAAERAEWTKWNDDMRAQIRKCRRCDAGGQYTTDDGLWWCEHGTAGQVDS